MAYHGQFGIDEYLHKEFFLGNLEGYFIECGACDGILESTCLFLEEDLGWTGINIEASPPLFDKLVLNRPNSRNLNYALSNQSDVAEFTHAIRSDCPSFGNGSLHHVPEHMIDLVNQGCSFEKYQVITTRFSAITDIDRPIDLFVLDVEGHELEALEGILDGPNLPRIMCVEHTLVGIKQLIAKMSKLYTMYSIVNNNAIFTIKKD